MQITRGRKRPRESGALAQSGVQSRNWELRECRIGEIMRDCISLMMTFISLDIFFAMLSTPTAFFCLASAFGPSRYDSRVPRDPQRGGNGSRGRCRETAPGRAVHSPPPLLDERVLSDGAGSCQVETSPRSRTTRPVWRRHGRRSSGPPTPLSRGRAAGAAARPRRRSRRSLHPSHRPFFLMKSRD